MDICVQINLGIYVYCAKMKDECYKIKLDFTMWNWGITERNIITWNISRLFQIILKNISNKRWIELYVLVLLVSLSMSLSKDL